MMIPASIESLPNTAEDRWVGPRYLWLGAAALQGMLCASVLATTMLLKLSPEVAALWRSAAQFGFAHCMATIACLMLANAGARRLRMAPVLFVGGSTIVLTAMAIGYEFSLPWRGVALSGVALCLTGWAILLRGIIAIAPGRQPIPPTVS